MALMKAFLRFRPISSSLCRHTSTVACADSGASAASELHNLSSPASAEAEKAVRNGPRNDWTKPEIQAVYDSPIMDLLFHGADLVGGYYDAGDNVKHGLPMAFTVTILAWGAPQYRDELSAAGELENVRDPDAIKWGTDYFIKASATENQRLRCTDMPTNLERYNNALFFLSRQEAVLKIVHIVPSHLDMTLE